MKKHLLMLAVSIILVMGLIGCSNNSSSDSGKSGDKVNITIWHSMSGDNGKNFQQIVDDFNKQSDKVFVKAVYQGDYTDMITKVRAISSSDKAPALIQASGTNRKYLSQSDFITPMQQFIDEEKYDTSDIEPNVLNRYTIDNKLYSMPFSASNAVMFYNKDLFKKAGLDPENPPTTYEGIAEAGQKIKEKTKKIGFSKANNGWYFEELLANVGQLYLDNDNGFSGKPTKTLIDGDAGTKIFQWLDEMNKAGTFKNYGPNWEDPRGPFLAGQLAMYFDSSANTRSIVEQAPFEVGTAPLPVPEGVEAKGETVGGNSIYITNKVSKEDQEAAWEFIKYLVSPKVQAKWASLTGYFPVTKTANDEQILKDTYNKFPQMLTAVNVNSMTPAIPATSGPLSDEGEQFRSIVSAAQEKVFEGGNPQSAIKEAAQKINDLLKKN